MDIHKRLAYLHQAQSLLNKTRTEKRGESDVDLSLTKLNSFYGFLAKEIVMKHNVQILNSDPLRQLRCKRCFCQYDLNEMLANGFVKTNCDNNSNKKKKKKKKRRKSDKKSLIQKVNKAKPDANKAPKRQKGEPAQQSQQEADRPPKVKQKPLKCLNLKCCHCAFPRKVIFNERNKTKFEKLLFEPSPA